MLIPRFLNSCCKGNALFSIVQMWKLYFCKGKTYDKKGKP